LERTNGLVTPNRLRDDSLRHSLAAWTLRSVSLRDPSCEPIAKRQTWFAVACTLALIVLVGTLDGPSG
jgi:hypothetical protein